MYTGFSEKKDCMSLLTKICKILKSFCKAKKWSCILCSVLHWLPMITRQPLEILNEKLTVHWKVIPHSIPLHDKQYYSNVMHKEDEVIKKRTDFKP